MAASLPFLSDLPEPDQTMPAGMQQLGVLHDEHGSLLLRQFYYPPEQLLWGQWHGNLTAESVIAGARASFPVLQQLRPSRLLNDKSTATGDWTEALDWLEFEWLPLALNYGLRSFAYVFAPDMHNQLAALEFLSRVRQHLAIELFYDADAARTWLRRQP